MCGFLCDALVQSSAQTGVDVKFFKIYRWNPDKPGEKPHMATYPVKTKECV